ncbi:MAG: 2-oxo acid dehydrogenase subunit E2 [Firmicutes bacterium]|nr:2-oxo acid dehydrogenase subunit E2 [Bacillota bacterium]
MAHEILMPKLGLLMTQGTIDTWLKPNGSRVTKGEALLEITNDKVTNTVEAMADGVLHITVAAGNTAPVGQVIGYLLDEGEEMPTAASGASFPASQAKEAAEVAAPPRASKEIKETRVRATPAAKRMAREKGVDLAQVTGTGPEGRITETDVENFLVQKAPPSAEQEQRLAVKATPTAAKLAQELGVDLTKLTAERRLTKEDVLAAVVTSEESTDRRVPLAGMRRVIARRMKESWSLAPHVTINMEVDMSQTKRIRAELNESVAPEEKVSFNDLIIKAAAFALTRFPPVNATLTESEIIYHEHVHMGVAVALENGLIVPVVRDADKKPIYEVARETKELAEKARSNRISPDEVTGSTFTVTNLGMYGVDDFTPIINQPESAILGVGVIKDRPVVVDGVIEVRPVMKLSLSFDHRLIDGSVAAEFLGLVRDLLEKPYGLRMELL